MLEAIQGGAALARKMQALPDKLQKTILRQAVLAGARVMADVSRAEAPIRSQAGRRRKDGGAKRQEGLVLRRGETFAPTLVPRDLDKRSKRSQAFWTSPANVEHAKSWGHVQQVAKPGTLRKSIRSKRGRGSPGEVVAGVAIGKRAFYWRFLEFGTKTITARSFLAKALASSEEAAFDAVGGYIRQRFAELGR